MCLLQKTCDLVQIQSHKTESKFRADACMLQICSRLFRRKKYVLEN